MRQASPAPAPAPARLSTPQAREPLPPARAVAAWPSLLAGVFCVLIALLGVAPGVRAQGGDSVAMLFLAVCGAVAFLSPLRSLFFPRDESDEPRARNVATFALLCAMSVLFPLARLWAPIEKLSFRLPLFEEPFPISLAAALAILGAILTFIPTWRVRSGIVRASLLALAIVSILALGSFRLLSRFYTVGPVDRVVDPTSLVVMLQQVVEWGAIVLLCHAATAHRLMRRWVLGAMIVALVLVWARQHTLPPLSEDE